jgi:hypothetical protein
MEMVDYNLDLIYVQFLTSSHPSFMILFLITILSSLYLYSYLIPISNYTIYSIVTRTLSLNLTISN